MRMTFISNYFGFNKQQRNGLLVLVCISLFLLVIRVLYPYFIPPGEVQVENLPLVRIRLDSSYDVTAERAKNYRTENKKSLFVFDPNTVTYDQLLVLGFSKKTAPIFLKFRDKGFHFKKKEDLKKVFGVSERLYNRLEPYILIPTTIGTEEKSPAQNKMVPEHREEKSVTPGPRQVVPPLDLNLADSAALIEVNGIGPVYAKRILKYRSLLGGFVNVSQLKEVYGFPEDLYEKVKNQLIVTPFEVKKMNLNKDDFKTVNRHPYLSYELTKQIFDWRRKTTITATNLPDILNDPLICAKILPYLTFD